MKFLTTFASALVLCSLLAYPHVNAQSSDHHVSHDLTRERAINSNAHPSESAAPNTAAPKTTASKRTVGVAKRPVQEAPKEVEGEEEEQVQPPARKTTGKRSTGKSKKEVAPEEEEEQAAKKTTGKRSTGKSKKEEPVEEEEQPAKKTTGKKSTGKSTGAPGAKKVTSPNSGETHPGGITRESGKVSPGKNPLPKKSNPPPVAKKGETHPPVEANRENHPPIAKKGESSKNPPVAKKGESPKNPPPAAKKVEEAKKAVTKKPISKKPLVPSGRLEVQKCASSSNEYLDLKWVRASPFPLTVKSPLNLRIHGNFPKGLERGSKLDIIAKVLFFSQTVTLDICEELETSKAKVKCPLTPGDHTLLLTVPQDKLKPFNIDIQAKAKDPKGRDLFCFNTVMSFKS